MYYDLKEFPDRVTRSADGIYRWAYRMNPRRNKHALSIMVKVYGSMGVLAAIGLLIVGSPNPLTMSRWDMPLMVLGLFLGLFLLTAGIMYLMGDDPIPFAMDEEKVTTFRGKYSGHHTLSRVRRVRLIPQYDAIRLELGVTLYIPPEDYAMVKAFLLEHLPQNVDIRE